MCCLGYIVRAFVICLADRTMIYLLCGVVTQWHCTLIAHIIDELYYVSAKTL
ncbi:hypothetical protein GE21DRAFT_1049263 [Neurospora crassa]|nr:hypothetical protein GE21DRAFT_1049263 [Neurospora crassa]